MDKKNPKPMYARLGLLEVFAFRDGSGSPQSSPRSCAGEVGLLRPFDDDSATGFNGRKIEDERAPRLRRKKRQDGARLALFGKTPNRLIAT